MTPQNFYARRRQRSRSEVDARFALELARGYRLIHPRMGTRKLYYLMKSSLKEGGVKMGRDRLFNVLRQEGLLVPPKRSKWPKTTQYRSYLPRFKNRIRKVKLVRPNQVWITDITYIRTKEDFFYLFLLSDKYSRKILSFELSESLESGAALRVLKRALKRVKEPSKLIHHSDRGCQYACHKYVKALKDVGAVISMTEHDHCAENAQAERVNGIIKGEYGLDEEFESRRIAEIEIRRTIFKYNDLRPHDSLFNKTPTEVHRSSH
jgi:putative transposase